MLDLQYHDIQRQRSLYYLLERNGAVDRLFTDEEDVEKVFGGDQLLEEKANRLLDRERLPPFRREDDPVLSFHSIDAFLHLYHRSFGFLSRTLCKNSSPSLRSPTFSVLLRPVLA